MRLRGRAREMLGTCEGTCEGDAIEGTCEEDARDVRGGVRWRCDLGDVRGDVRGRRELQLYLKDKQRDGLGRLLSSGARTVDQ